MPQNNNSVEIIPPITTEECRRMMDEANSMLEYADGIKNQKLSNILYSKEALAAKKEIEEIRKESNEDQDDE